MDKTDPCEVWTPLPLSVKNLKSLKKSQFVSFRMPSSMLSSRKNEAFTWSENVCISWSKPYRLPVFICEAGRAVIETGTPNGGGGLRPYSQMGLGSLAPAARGCDPSCCGMELLLPIGMKQRHILKWSHNFKLFWVKRSFSQWSPWFIPLGWIKIM